MSLIEHLDNYLELITYGFTNPMPDSNEGPWKITAKDVINGKINYDTARKTTIDSFENDLTPKSKPKINDILLTKDGTLGRLAIVDQENICVNQSVAVLRPNKKIIPQFLYYLLSSPYYQKTMLNDSDGSVLKHIYITRVKKMDVQIPDLTHQKKIIQILELIDNKIDVLIKLNKNLEDQLSLIFDDMFIKCSNYDEESLVKTDWEKIPKEWENIDFGDIIKITSGDRPDEKSEIKTSEFNIPLFGASKIMGYTKEFSYNEDILIIGRVGTHGVIQRVNYPCFPSDNTFVIKSEYYGFVYQLLKRIDYDSLNTGSTQPLITQKSLKTVNVVLPDKNSLFSFEKISKTIFDKIYINQNEISILQKLRDTLLPKLMSGEIDVSEINCDLKIIIRKIYIKSSKLFLWRYLSENKNYIKNTKSNETLLKSRTIYKINKFLAKFNARYRYYRQ